jgi:hypothetical protein
MTIPRLSGIAERVETLFPPATPYYSARLYRGGYVTGTDINEHEVIHDFWILSGEAMIRKGRPVLVSSSTSQGGTSVLEVFYIYPMSPVVRVGVRDGRGESHLILYRDVDRSDSGMFKQLTTDRILGFAD